MFTMPYVSPEERMYRLCRALVKIESSDFYDPMPWDSFTTRQIAEKLGCNDSNVFRLIAAGELIVRKESIEVKRPGFGGFQQLCYKLDRKEFLAFLERRIVHPFSSSWGLISVEEVLGSKLSSLNDIAELFGYTPPGFVEGFVEQPRLTYVGIGCGAERSRRRFVCKAFQKNLLDIIADSLGLSERIYTPSLLAKRWRKKLKDVFYITDQKMIRSVSVASPLNGLRFYLESGLRQFEKEHTYLAGQYATSNDVVN